ncbi:MAG: NAD(P)/FAD-dependent oxidoreductase [Methanotrichaceae archaeon]|nr:NAD(P)/FAD-dependent oxidoreductase [Methanotrichaceae archaeon]
MKALGKVEEVDVIVVGAGPAGSTAAERAAAAGASVLLIDRKEEVGSPVQCGGFLPEAHELQALMPHADLPATLVEIPERCVLHRTEIQRLYAPSGRSKEFPVDGRVIDRRAFDRHLAYRAISAGAKMFVGTTAAPERGFLRLRGRGSGLLSPRVVVGADGPASALARSLGVSHRMEMGICLELEMAGVEIDAQAAEMYFGTRFAPGGYAWIIPLGEEIANVGVGVRRSYMDEKMTLSALLDRFIMDHPIAGPRLRRGQVMAVMRGTVPAGGMVGPIQGGRILLAGDAAGHVMATSGGGIPLAVVAGSIAGLMAARSLQGEASLNDYPRMIHESFGRELDRSVQMRRLVDLLMKRDHLMDTLFDHIDAEQMKAMQRGSIPGALGRICDALARSG